MDFNKSVVEGMEDYKREVNAIKLMTQICAIKFKESIRYVDFNGMVHEAIDAKDRWHKIYLEGLMHEAIKFAESTYTKNNK